MSVPGLAESNAFSSTSPPSRFSAIYYTQGCNYHRIAAAFSSGSSSECDCDAGSGSGCGSISSHAAGAPLFQDVEFVFVEKGGGGADGGHWSPPSVSTTGLLRSKSSSSSYRRNLVSDDQGNIMYGLQTGKTWRYDRIFAEIDSPDCPSGAVAVAGTPGAAGAPIVTNVDSPVFGGEQKRWQRCFVSASVAAQWVNDLPIKGGYEGRGGKAYSMRLMLPVGQLYWISALTGLEGCSRSLEHLSSADFERMSTACTDSLSNNTTITDYADAVIGDNDTYADVGKKQGTCEELCVAVDENSSSSRSSSRSSMALLAKFSVDLRRQEPATVTALNSGPTTDTTTTTSNECGLHDLRGIYWKGMWTSPYACKSDPPYRCTGHSSNNNNINNNNINNISNSNSLSNLSASPIKPPPSPPPSPRNMCVIGDSHMVRSQSFLKEAAARAHLRFSFEGNYVFQKNLSTPLTGETYHPKTLSVLGSMRQCMRTAATTAAEMKFSKLRKSAASVVVGNTAIVWWFGSHAYALSPAEIARTVEQAQHYLLTQNMSPCVIVVGIPDLLYERIPAKFGRMRKYFQNSWRIKAQNRALREAVETVSISLTLTHVNRENNNSNSSNSSSHSHSNSNSSNIKPISTTASGVDVTGGLSTAGTTSPNKRAQFHYMDIYEQSLALHFDGHTHYYQRQQHYRQYEQQQKQEQKQSHAEDPVHFTSSFYEQLAKLMVSEVMFKC